MKILLAVLHLAVQAAAPAPDAVGAKPSADAVAAKPSPDATTAKPRPPTHVEADHIEYRYRERQTVMTGKPLVTLIREGARLVCRRLVADTTDGGDIDHAVCEGDVKLTRGDRTVTCARATYDGTTGRVVCRGDPVLRDGESVIFCDVAIYDLDADRVQLTKPKGTLIQKPGQPLPIAKGRER